MVAFPLWKNQRETTIFVEKKPAATIFQSSNSWDVAPAAPHSPILILYVDANQFINPKRDIHGARGNPTLASLFQVKYGVKYHVLQLGGPLVYTPTTCQQETSNMSGSMYSYVQMAKTVNLEDNPVEKGQSTLGHWSWFTQKIVRVDVSEWMRRLRKSENLAFDHFEIFNFYGCPTVISCGVCFWDPQTHIRHPPQRP